MEGFEGEMFINLKRLNVVDIDHPNVLIVITHVMSIPMKHFQKTIEELKTNISTLAYKHLNVKVRISYIENHPDDYELAKIASSWQLPDGTQQPGKQFDDMIALLEGNKDHVAIAAIKTFSRYRFVNQPILTRAILRSKIKPHDIKKWQTKLLKKPTEFLTNEVADALMNYESKEELIENGRLTPLIHLLFKTNFCYFKDLEGKSIYDICNVLSYDYISLEPIEKKALIEVFNVLPQEFHNITQKIGKSYSILDKVILNDAIFRDNDDFYIVNGTRIPSCIEMIEDESIVVGCKKVVLDVENPDNGATYSYQFTVTQKEFRLILKINNELAKYVKDEFKEDVALLPEVTDPITDEIFGKYREFSEKYGHYIVSQCNGGGFITGQIAHTNEISTKMNRKSIRNDIAIYLTNLPKEVEIGRNRSTFEPEKVLDTDIKFIGGTCPPCRNLRELTSEMYSQWLASLIASPNIIKPKRPTSEMYSIHHIVDLIGQNGKAQMIKKMYTSMFEEYANSCFKTISLKTIQY